MALAHTQAHFKSLAREIAEHALTVNVVTAGLGHSDVEELMKDLLEGERIYFRLIEREDLPQRVKWINDPAIQHTLNYDYPTSLARTQKWFDTVLMDSSRRDFSVLTLADDTYIGFCGLINIEELVKKAEMYAVIGDREYWGAGYGTEIYRVLMNYGFNEIGLNKIYGYQLVHNEAAHRVVEKLGWKRDGLLRQDIYSHGRIRDRYIVSILRRDWKDASRRNRED
jgi:RimJ/RimL family protein N-acetyltransferase